MFVFVYRGIFLFLASLAQSGEHFGPGFKSQPGTVAGPVIITMWGPQPG